MDAISNVYQSRIQQLHEEERPTALLTSIYVNSQRDSKKTKPFDISKFYLYDMMADKDSMKPVYARAIIRLANEKKLPYWALFIYKNAKEAYDKKVFTGMGSLSSEDAIIIAPSIGDHEIKGLLIALESASGRKIKMKDDDGKIYEVQIPILNAKCYAEEDVTMRYRVKSPRANARNKNVRTDS